MKIEISNKKEIKKNKSFFSEAINTIIGVCRVDPNFDKQNKLKDLEEQLQQIKEKIKKQDSLLNKSIEIKHQLENRLKISNDKLSDDRDSLLERLGSEI